MATTTVSRVIKSNHEKNGARASLPKTPTGIEGLDEITHGGLTAWSPFADLWKRRLRQRLFWPWSFLVRGATQFGEPGVFIAFEETAEELTQNVKSLGFDLPTLIRRKKLLIDYVRVNGAKSRKPASTISKACSSA